MSNVKDDETLLKILLDEKNDENIFLFGEDDEEVELEQLGIVPFEDNLYALLRPTCEDEDVALVFKVDHEDENSIMEIEDETLAQKIIEIFNKS